MELKSEQCINLPQRQVWLALNDADVLKRCIPQCESVEKLSEREFRVVMLAAIGPVRAKFTARLEYTKLEAPDSCSMMFEGQGGTAGFGKGEAQLVLVPEGNATILKYLVKAQIGGKLAQIGSRLVDASARKIADDFFTKFNEVVVPTSVESEAAPADRPNTWTLRIIVAIVALLAGGLLYWAHR
jgi:carbon monoxide dehydrogenase subunit G